MQKRFGVIRRAGFVIVSIIYGLGISSCIDYDEDVTLNPDGSGRVRQVLQLEERYYEILLKSGSVPLTRDSIEQGLPPGAKLVNFASELSGKNRRRIMVDIEFKDLIEVFRLIEEGRAFFFGKVYWKRDYLGRINYQRVLKKKGEDFVPPGPFKNILQSSPARGAMVPFNLKFTFRSPYRVIRSNATEVKDKELSWKIPLMALFYPQNEVVLRAQLEKPLSTVKILGIYLGIVLTVVLFIIFWVRRRNY